MSGHDFLHRSSGTRKSDMPTKVLLAQFMHETNTFSHRETDTPAFRGFYCYEGPALIPALRGTANEVAGFVDVAEAEGWELVPTVATFATPGGAVSDRAWTDFVGTILRIAREQGPFDAVLLSLHGAMVRADGRDGDALLLHELRQIVGPDCPIAVTLDLHANLAPQMAEDAEILMSYKTFPHIDMRDTGAKAARALAEILRGQAAMRTVIRKLPMLTLPEGGRTDREPMEGLQKLARRLEADAPEICDISINAGFSLADVPEIGPSVTVCHRDAPERAARIAEQIAEAMWQVRDETGEPILTPTEAAELARTHAENAPLVLADLSDNPGDGAYADATEVLGALIEKGGDNILLGALCDPDAVVQAQRTGVGAQVALSLGGHSAPEFGGAPLKVTAEVRALSDGTFICDGPMWNGVAQSCGAAALLRIEDVDVLVSSIPTQALDMGIFRALGAEPTRYRVVALKSVQHFRAAYTPYAARIALVDGGGLASPRSGRRTYARIPRPIHPLDEWPGTDFTGHK
jgi:microcystin degradation protein MlrC